MHVCFDVAELPTGEIAQFLQPHSTQSSFPNILFVAELVTNKNYLVKMLRVVTTHVPVMSRLLNGADLMLPGVIVDDSKAIKVFDSI